MGSNTTAPTPRHRRRLQTTAAVLFAGTLALTACAGDDNDAGDDALMEAPAEDSGDIAASDGGFVDSAGDATEPAEDTAGGFDIGIVGRDVIIEMRVVVSSDDVQRTVSSVMAHASALGGGVASSDVNYGNPDQFGGDQGYAVLVVKVPPESVDSLLAGLDDTGTVQSINQSAQDVTEQLIDLNVRISNARQSVANVREFMERTENLNELVTLEGELTRRQTELERLEAQQRNLQDRVALSTVTIEVIPTESVPEPVDDDDSIGDAFAEGWDAFTGFIFGVGYILAVLLPFLALGAIGAGIVWMLVRRRNRRRPASPAATEADRPLPEPVPTPASTSASTSAPAPAPAPTPAQVSPTDDENASPPE